MRHIQVIISGGTPEQNREVCTRCCGFFRRGAVANSTEPVRDQNGAYFFYVDVDGRMGNNRIAQTIYTICNEGQMVTIDGNYYERN